MVIFFGDVCDIASNMEIQLDIMLINQPELGFDGDLAEC